MPAMKSPKTLQEATESVEAFTVAGQTQIKEGMERSMAAMAEVGAFGKENVEAFVASATATTKGLEAITARATAYSKAALENHVAAAKSIMTSKSVQEAVEKQTAYAKSTFEGYVAEMTKMTELMQGFSKEAAKPLTERVSAVQHLIQTTAVR